MKFNPCSLLLQDIQNNSASIATTVIVTIVTTTAASTNVTHLGVEEAGAAQGAHAGSGVPAARSRRARHGVLQAGAAKHLAAGQRERGSF